MRVRERWVAAGDTLGRLGVEDASIEAEVILRHAMGADRARFFASLNDELSPSVTQDADRLLQRRCSGEPLAYIFGFREFYGLDMTVNSSVLIPRQETELLVDRVLDFARDRGEGLVIADVGTGSGAIAIAIAHHLPQATIYATDISPEALRVADVNRRRHGVSARVHLRRGDLLDAIPETADVIVCNLPYLTSTEMAGLKPEVGREPPMALYGGTDGLEVISRLLRQAPSRLRDGGVLLLEIAPPQLRTVLQMGRKEFPKARLSFHRDLLGLPRVVSLEAARPSDKPVHASRVKSGNLS